MASRLLSNTLQSRARFSKQLVRPLATTAMKGFATRTTVLPNGLTIATQETPSSGAATVGVWADAGSRVESVQTNGIANFVGHVAFQNKAADLEKLGGIALATTTREHSVFATKVLGANVSASVDILADIIQNPAVDASVFEQQRNAILKQQEQLESQLDQVVFDHLHATAFQGESLGRPVVGYKETVESFTAQDIAAFKQENFTANRLVLVGTGDVDHDALVRDAEKAFGALASAPEVTEAKPAFTGSEIRLRDDLLPSAHIALAVEGAPYLSAEYFQLLVMQTIIGSYDRTLGGAANLTSRLSTIVDSNHLADSFASFTKGYKDTGLFGIYAVTRNRDQIDDFVHFLQREWARLSTSVTASEVEVAKQQLKASLLLSTDSTCAAAHDIGSQVLASGKHLTAEELKQTIAKISVQDIRRAAGKFLWDQEVAVVGAGPIECLTDYNRVRGLMAYNRF